MKICRFFSTSDPLSGRICTDFYVDDTRASTYTEYQVPKKLWAGLDALEVVTEEESWRVATSGEVVVTRRAATLRDDRNNREFMVKQL